MPVMLLWSLLRMGPPSPATRCPVTPPTRHRWVAGRYLALCVTGTCWSRARGKRGKVSSSLFTALGPQLPLVLRDRTGHLCAVSCVGNSVPCETNCSLSSTHPTQSGPNPHHPDVAACVDTPFPTFRVYS